MRAAAAISSRTPRTTIRLPHQHRDSASSYPFSMMRGKNKNRSRRCDIVRREVFRENGKK
jgi:hypothetical protein